MQEITLKQIKPFITKCIAANIVPYIQGSPGIGKSALGTMLAEELNAAFIDVRLAQSDPTDLNGFPAIIDNQATFLPFDIFPTENTPLPKGKNGWVIMLDELSSCAKAVQAAAYKIILDRMVGQHKLHPKVRLLAAGNLETDGAVVQKMSTALGSRMVHFKIGVSHPEFIEYATDSGLDSRIISFLEFRKPLLHSFEPKKVETTFPCPRTWEMLSKLIKGEQDVSAFAPLINGTIGDGAGAEFRGFCNLYHKLPKMADIIANPKSVFIPNESGINFALAGAVSDVLSAKNADSLLDFVDRLPIEMQVICIRKAYKINPDMTSNKKVDKWLDTNANRFIK